MIRHIHESEVGARSLRCLDRVREYVFLIGKKTNAYTLMPIKIHLIQKRRAYRN